MPCVGLKVRVFLISNKFNRHKTLFNEAKHLQAKYFRKLNSIVLQLKTVAAVKRKHKYRTIIVVDATIIYVFDTIIVVDATIMYVFDLFTMEVRNYKISWLENLYGI